MIKRYTSNLLAILMFAALFLGLGGTAHAAIDTALSGLVTDVKAYWDTVQAVVLTVVIFGIAITFAKRLKRS